LQLAGVVAVEVTGGPEIPFHPGREVRFFIHFSLSLGFRQGLSSCFEISEGVGVKVVQ
jgi:hypothetical protein